MKPPNRLRDTFRMDPAIARLVTEAQAAGRHSPIPRKVCGGCGDWTERVMARRQDGAALCPRCAPPDPKPLRLADLDKLRHPDDRSALLRALQEPETEEQRRELEPLVEEVRRRASQARPFPRPAR